ncbi:hypothetical protein OLMES_1121 [Oleiphilus messinensis]|uniref:Uncharacterized protein n=1 Tax=Oleiphilus messinensis TaxID=141451 RepID=A0A1Y0I5Y0_9GAMM|nr:hypothetical protein OLMES_1121 [Oleiphilus messinensis]
MLKTASVKCSVTRCEPIHAFELTELTLLVNIYTVNIMLYSIRVKIPGLTQQDEYNT